MNNSTFVEIDTDVFHNFLKEALSEHGSKSLIDELDIRRFHSMNSFKKDFINEILNNYYGMQYVGIVGNISRIDNPVKYKLNVINKSLCTFFLLKYGS